MTKKRGVKPWLVFLGVSFLFGISTELVGQVPRGFPDDQITLRSWNEGARYFTTGTIRTEGWHSRFRETVLDFDSYQHWATLYLDGTHEFSRRHWVHFQGFFHPDPQTMVMVYDMNRWPLVGKNNRAYFILETRQNQGQDQIWFRLRRPPVGLHGGQLTLAMAPETGLEFTLELHLWGLVSALMNNDSFTIYMERLVGRMVQNMIEYVQDAGSLRVHMDLVSSPENMP